MGDCNTCPLYQAAEKFALTSCRRSPDREYQTEHGRMIAAGVSAKRLSLSETSRAAGYASDYVTRVCRGDLPLNRRAATLIGGVLGIDLTGYVVDERKLPPTTDAPALPGIGAAVGGTSPLKFETAS